MKKHQILAAAAAVIFVGSFFLAENLPSFLRTDLPGDTMLGGCIGLFLWAVALILALLATYFWYQERKASASDKSTREGLEEDSK